MFTELKKILYKNLQKALVSQPQNIDEYLRNVTNDLSKMGSISLFHATIKKEYKTPVKKFVLDMPFEGHRTYLHKYVSSIFRKYGWSPKIVGNKGNLRIFLTKNINNINSYITIDDFDLDKKRLIIYGKIHKYK